MKAVQFPQVNLQLASDQPEYETLPSYVKKRKVERIESESITSCFELDDEEIAEIVRTKKIWHTQMTFGQPFQPVLMSTKSPFPLC